jgi:hypothetical protein
MILNLLTGYSFKRPKGVKLSIKLHNTWNMPLPDWQLLPVVVMGSQVLASPGVGCDGEMCSLACEITSQYGKLASAAASTQCYTNTHLHIINAPAMDTHPRSFCCLTYGKWSNRAFDSKLLHKFEMQFSPCFYTVTSGFARRLEGIAPSITKNTFLNIHFMTSFPQP